MACLNAEHRDLPPGGPGRPATDVRPSGADAGGYTQSGWHRRRVVGHASACSKRFVSDAVRTVTAGPRGECDRYMACPTPGDEVAGRHGGTTRDRVGDALAGPLLGQRVGRPTYTTRQQQQVLAKAGQVIVEWAVEVARYEADIDWQWVHGDDDDPAATLNALTRLISESRSVVERAEALLLAALPDDER